MYPHVSRCMSRQQHLVSPTSFETDHTHAAWLHPTIRKPIDEILDISHLHRQLYRVSPISFEIFRSYTSRLRLPLRQSDEENTSIREPRKSFWACIGASWRSKPLNTVDLMLQLRDRYEHQ